MTEAVILEVNFNSAYGAGMIFPVILKDDKNTVLIDCGFKGFLPRIEKAAEDKGVSLSELTDVVITHHDHDHMGSLAALKSKYPSVRIIAGEKEIPYISGAQKSLRLIQAEELQDKLPAEEQKAGQGFINLLRSIEPCATDIGVKDGDVFPWCGCTEIVGTPGHMPGHIAVYVRKLKMLITGDALALENGVLMLAAPRYTLDIEEAKRSVSKLLKYDIETVVCYHGGVFSGDVSGALEALV